MRGLRPRAETHVVSKPKNFHPPFAELIRDQLVSLHGIRIRPRRRVRGLYYGGVCFGIMDTHRLYLRTDAETRRDYEAHGMKCFDRMLDPEFQAYFEVPMEIVDDRAKLVRWARRAIQTTEEERPKRPRISGTR